MSEKHASTSRAPVWSAVSVAVVLVLAGYLFAANARLVDGSVARQPQDLAGLVHAEAERNATLQEEVDQLQSEVDRLRDSRTADLPTSETEQADVLAAAAGLVDVTGPGLTVSLSDAPTNVTYPDSVTNDHLIVHQQDLQAVINALWAGGAEAMTLQGQRVISTSAFRCVGNVLLLHGRHYSPPFVVEAIGDPDRMAEALAGSEEVGEYLQAVEVLGLGWSVTEEEQLELPAYTGSQELRYAAVPKDVDPLDAVVGS